MYLSKPTLLCGLTFNCVKSQMKYIPLSAYHPSIHSPYTTRHKGIQLVIIHLFWCIRTVQPATSRPAPSGSSTKFSNKPLKEVGHLHDVSPCCHHRYVRRSRPSMGRFPLAYHPALRLPGHLRSFPTNPSRRLGIFAGYPCGILLCLLPPLRLVGAVCVLCSGHTNRCSPNLGACLADAEIMGHSDTWNSVCRWPSLLPLGLSVVGIALRSLGVGPDNWNRPF